ncbi:hypothetical protein [Streptomyces griseoflavus]|uniref:hypothetical protein n=1 Tax=Streptomyces griseoflavus TaxID=35619 RepID=UPI003D7609A8
MNLEGIGAISAAAVAALGIPTAVVVGRWQMRGALRAAEETGRAGVAQAEATYKAALDAVRTEAGHAHLQWRRGVQRDAYAALLLAATRCVHVGWAIPRGRVTSSEVEDSESDLIRAKNELGNALWVVKLEGPADVASAAENVHALARQVGDALRRKAEYWRAHALLEHLAESDPRARQLSDALIRLSVIVDETGYNSRTRASADIPDAVSEQAQRVHELIDAMSGQVGVSEWGALFNEALNYLDDPDALERSFSSAVDELLAACRQALGAFPNDSTPP